MKLLFALIPLFATIGCSSTLEGAKNDVQKNSREASAKLKDGIDSASNIKIDGEEVAKAGKNILAAAELTTRIKNAINADKGLNASGNLIDVDSDKDQVTLNGHVHSKALLNRAVTIAKVELAKAKASQKLVNKLTIK